MLSLFDTGIKTFFNTGWGGVLYTIFDKSIFWLNEWFIKLTDFAAFFLGYSYIMGYFGIICFYAYYVCSNKICFSNMSLFWNVILHLIQINTSTSFKCSVNIWFIDN